MFISLKRIMEWILLFVFFLMFTLILYKVVFFFSYWVQPLDKYKEPIGHSIKVVDMDKREALEGNFLERLQLFYIVGE